MHLLWLWHKLGVPYDLLKQEHGKQLTIIVLDVDTMDMMIAMPPQAWSNLLAPLHDFTHVGQQHPLHEFQHLPAWISWSLNAYPMVLTPLFISAFNHIPEPVLGLSAFKHFWVKTYLFVT